jgi:predicted  nucleic acid-binding Zn-ribbon protein
LFEAQLSVCCEELRKARRANVELSMSTESLERSVAQQAAVLEDLRAKLQATEEDLRAKEIRLGRIETNPLYRTASAIVRFAAGRRGKPHLLK